MSLFSYTDSIPRARALFPRSGPDIPPPPPPPRTKGNAPRFVRRLQSRDINYIGASINSPITPRERTIEFPPTGIAKILHSTLFPTRRSPRNTLHARLPEVQFTSRAPEKPRAPLRAVKERARARDKDTESALRPSNFHHRRAGASLGPHSRYQRSICINSN